MDQNDFIQYNNNNNNNNNNNRNINKNGKSISQNLKDLLDTKTGTVIASAIGMTIGISFNDFIRSFVNNILQPIIIHILYMSRINNYFDFASLVSEKNNALSLTNFISSIITFVFILFTVYYVNIYATKVI